MITCENETEIFNRLIHETILSESIDVMNPEYVHRVLFYFQEYYEFMNYMVSKEHVYQILMSKHENKMVHSIHCEIMFIL